MELNNIKTPSELTPCPVVEASMEVRFSRSDTPIEVIMSMIIENVRDKFENFQKLPIANLPENIRDADPNLKYASLYYMTSKQNKNIRLQVGKGTLSVISTGEYLGWKDFSKYINETLKIGVDSSLLKNSLERIGLRYISFFEGSSIFDNLNGEYTFINSPFSKQKHSAVRTEFEYSSFKCIAQITTAAKVNDKEGSVIDLDVIKKFTESCKTKTITDFISLIEEAHNVEKNIIFNLLKKKYVDDNFKPKYD